MTKEILSYKFRIYPDEKQEAQLFRTIGCARKMYNLILEQKNADYTLFKEGTITKKEHSDLNKKLNPSKFSSQEEYAYFKNVDSTALKYAMKHVNQAFSNFFKGNAEYPEFKKRNKSKLSYTTCRAGKNTTNVQLTKHGLKLPKIPGFIRTIVHRNPKGNLVSVTITKTASGKWFASLQYEANVKYDVTSTLDKSITSIKNPVGMDLGLKDLAILSDGTVFENVKALKQAQEKLARVDKSLSRKREQAKKDNRNLSECANYQKNKQYRAKLHEKIRNTRHDVLHKITHYLVNTHDFIGVENLSSSNMMKNHNLALAISDASWCEFITYLEYKAERHNVIIQKIDRYTASTQLCSHCLEKTGPKGITELNVREWECSNCHVIHDRDVNAAINILRVALELFIELTTGTVGETKNSSIEESLLFNEFPSLVLTGDQLSKSDKVLSSSQEKFNILEKDPLLEESS